MASESHDIDPKLYLGSFISGLRGNKQVHSLKQIFVVFPVSETRTFDCWTYLYRQLKSKNHVRPKRPAEEAPAAAEGNEQATWQNKATCFFVPCQPEAFALLDL